MYTHRTTSPIKTENHYLHEDKELITIIAKSFFVSFSDHFPHHRQIMFSFLAEEIYFVCS